MTNQQIARSTRDYAYGFNGNFLLPIKQFDRSCVPYKAKGGKVECPSQSDLTVEGICDANLSAENADTWAFLAAGAGFSFYCQTQIPLPALRPHTPAPARVRRSGIPRRSLLRRDATCDALKEPPFQFDNGPGW